jgi:hypothetical protein
MGHGRTEADDLRGPPTTEMSTLGGAQCARGSRDVATARFNECVLIVRGVPQLEELQTPGGERVACS